MSVSYAATSHISDAGKLGRFARVPLAVGVIVWRAGVSTLRDRNYILTSRLEYYLLWFANISFFFSHKKKYRRGIRGLGTEWEREGAKHYR